MAHIYVPISQDLLTGEASAWKKEKLSSVQNPLSPNFLLVYSTDDDNPQYFQGTKTSELVINRTSFNHHLSIIQPC